MNILLWVLQILLSLHTATGAAWKFSHSAGQTMPSLAVIPDTVWKAMSIFELICAVCLVLPAIYKPAGVLAPIAALGIAAEMLIFTGLHLYSREAGFGPIVYWLVVAVICAFIAYGRYVLKPHS
jgi:uncharacterized membrane protein YphA (DoxX/SURF4 family)